MLRGCVFGGPLIFYNVMLSPPKSDDKTKAEKLQKKTI
jgi:hypothetical protein